ncbi:MAG: formate acetyltransferase [Deltaproteobacteria bacterium]|jgi:formate C-acetyltransferase|nr:formate acetyltransferase [Deltaproteobacteria bacterium]
MKSALTPKPSEELYNLLKSTADIFNSKSELQDAMKGSQGWINATIGFKTADNKMGSAVVIKDGHITAKDHIPEDVDACLIFREEKDFTDYQKAGKDDASLMILKGRMWIEGTIALYNYCDYLVNLLYLDEARAATREIIRSHQIEKLRIADGADTSGRDGNVRRRAEVLRGEKVDPGVKWLKDPYLSEYTLDDFARVKGFRKERFDTKAEVSAEHGKLLTDFFLENGYEKKKDGKPWDPCLRKAESFYHLMANRKALIREGDLLAGTYTPNPIFGLVNQPYTFGWQVWGELRTHTFRELDSYISTEETIETLHKHVMPFYARRNIQDYWKTMFDTPLASRIHERYFSIFYYGTVSHATMTPGHEKYLQLGLNGMRDLIDRELARDKEADEEKKNTLKAMRISMDAVSAYSRNLAEQVLKEAEAASDPVRKTELEEIHRILLRVPDKPAETLHEAIQAMWIIQVALGLESTDEGPHLGRLDQLLQPYFDSDMKKLKTEEERKAYVTRAVELIGCLYMRLSSHYIITMEIVSWMNSGGPPSTVIVVGGVTREGHDAVNDMTYIILKVTAMLALNDPNMHARVMTGVNSETYLKRVCEVNYITGATPCIHNDAAMIESLSKVNPEWAIEDIRDWTANGCVEPCIPGMHFPTTGSVEFNLMAPLEMALNNGTHPLLEWDLGPRTGSVEKGDFKTFEDFFDAFKEQHAFLCGQGVIGNNQIEQVHQQHMPSPLMSSLVDDCISEGRGVTRGGARYNTSGITSIGLTDVTDSLSAIKRMVFDEKKISFKEFKEALHYNFEGHTGLRAWIQNHVPKFGSGDPDAFAMVDRVTRMVADFAHSQKTIRGGHYTSGWWSMNYHAVYGRVSGASPSGRLAGEAFTPGLTPQPSASNNIMDNLLDVAKLAPETLDNNIAFNIRVVPSPKDTHEQTIARMAQTLQTFFEQGGMQVQFIMLNTDTLKDAMAHPEYYPDLLVRISGYCAYFTQLHRDLQLEIIRRNEFGLG